MGVRFKALDVFQMKRSITKCLNLLDERLKMWGCALVWRISHEAYLRYKYLSDRLGLVGFSQVTQHSSTQMIRSTPSHS